jgi:enterochelin esterase family protein
MSSAGTGVLPMGGQTQAGSASGGMSTAGDAGSGGAAGTTAGAGGASGGGGAGSCSKMGTQADPGTDGDGKKQVDGPYKPAPETQMHLNNAPVGKINDMPIGAQIPPPLIYAATKQYPGLNQMLKYEYWIYVPSQYKAGCPAAMMVFQDGMHYVSTDSQFHIPVVFDNLIASGDIPVTIGVFINPGEPGSGHYDGNEQPNRSAQYDRNSPNYVNFLVDQFLTDIVLPKYDIVDDPEGWGISGHSSGGIAAFMAGWYRPEKFRKLFTHDASFPNTGNYMNMSLLGAVDAAPVKPLRVYLMSGPMDLGGWYNANTDAFNRLTAKQYHVQYITETSGHFPPQAGIQDVTNALKWMWRGYKL